MPEPTSPSKPDAPLPYPGHIVEMGDVDHASVKAVEQRLNQMGCGPLAEDGVFDADVLSAVKLFQARFPDRDGLSLKVDGRVGPITWATLFGSASVPVGEAAPSPLLAGTLTFAATQIGVREDPLGSNRGPEVDAYLRSVGCDPAENLPWCAAFVYFCFEKAAGALGQPNPVIKTAGVLDHWSKAGQRKIPRVLQADAVHDPSLVKPGFIFVLSSGGGHGHTGLVEEVATGQAHHHRREHQRRWLPRGNRRLPPRPPEDPGDHAGLHRLQRALGLTCLLLPYQRGRDAPAARLGETVSQLQSTGISAAEPRPFVFRLARTHCAAGCQANGPYGTGTCLFVVSDRLPLVTVRKTKYVPGLM